MEIADELYRISAHKGPPPERFTTARYRWSHKLLTRYDALVRHSKERRISPRQTL